VDSVAYCDVLRKCGSPTHPRRVRCRRDRPGQLRVDPFASSYAAFSCGSADITRFLIEHGADTTAWANDGRTALHVVVEVGSMEIVRIVVELQVGSRASQRDAATSVLFVCSGQHRGGRGTKHKFTSGPVLPEVENVRLVTVRLRVVSVFSSAIAAMFSERLSALLALIGVAVAAVQLPVQESDSVSEILAENQVPLRYSTQPEVANAWVDRPFDTNSLQPKFEPIGELSAVGSDQWTTLHHPVFPRYSVRIKQSRFCDTTVK